MSRRDKMLRARPEKDAEIASRSILSNTALNILYELHFTVEEKVAKFESPMSIVRYVRDRFAYLEQQTGANLTEPEIKWYLESYNLPLER